MAKSVRAFVAVEVNDEVRQAAVELIARLSASPASVKWVEPEGLHFTLKFLGDIELRSTGQVLGAIREAADKSSGFFLEIAGLGAFPDIERPRTVWAGVTQGSSKLVSLATAIDESLAELRFRPENRRYVPHLTLGRVKQTEEGVDELAAMLQVDEAIELGRVAVREVILFSSVLRRSGPVYDRLGQVKLP